MWNTRYSSSNVLVNRLRSTGVQLMGLDEDETLPGQSGDQGAHLPMTGRPGGPGPGSAMTAQGPGCLATARQGRGPDPTPETDPGSLTQDVPPSGGGMNVSTHPTAATLGYAVTVLATVIDEELIKARKV